MGSDNAFEARDMHPNDARYPLGIIRAATGVEGEPLTIRAAHDVQVLDNEQMVIGFCGFLTADLPELHEIHPQRVLDAWERFKVEVRKRPDVLRYGTPEHHENGDGVG